MDGMNTRPPGRRLAVASQLSMLGFQVVLPALLRFTAGRRNEFVKVWSTEALNFQLVWIALFVAMGSGAIVTHSTALGWVTAGVFEILAVYGVTCGIVGARKAWRGETWRYPVNARLVPGADDEALHRTLR